jgi:polar amino acid transport system substrate-binding protein
MASPSPCAWRPWSEPAGESYGAVFAKGSRLRGPVNRALTALKKDGTIAALQKRWLTADLSRLPVLR